MPLFARKRSTSTSAVAVPELNKRTLCDFADKESTNLRQAVLDHPFIRHMLTGAVSDARRDFFVAQEEYFVGCLERVIELGRCGAYDPIVLNWFHEGLKETIRNEHRRFSSRRFDVAFATDSFEEDEGHSISPVTLGYTDLLLEFVCRGNPKALIAAIIPRYHVRHLIRKQLESRPRSASASVAGWFDVERFDDDEEMFATRELADVLARISTKAEYNMMRHAYIDSYVWEYAYWQMAWDLDTWNSPRYGGGASYRKEPRRPDRTEKRVTANNQRLWIAGPDGSLRPPQD